MIYEICGAMEPLFKHPWKPFIEAQFKGGGNDTN